MGASFMLFLVMEISLFLVADWLGVADWFRLPISKRDPERGWAFWYAFCPLAAVSVLFGVLAGKRYSRDSQSWVDTIVGLLLVVLMCVLVVVAYLTGGK
jgi:polyferredoxin